MFDANPTRTRRAVAPCAVALALSAALFTVPRGAAANSVTVGCPGAVPGTYDYASLSGALTALKTVSYRDHFISVSGTCTEVVTLDWMENIHIAGTAGAALVEPPGPKLTYAVLALGGSAGITIENLTFRGGPARRALLNVYDSTLEIRDCVFEDSNEGIFVHGRSNVFIRSSVIQDIDGVGVRVDDNATVNIGDVQNDLVATIIRSNSTGLLARNDGVANIHGATSIEQNGTGISGEGGTVAFCCGYHETKVIDNRQGLSFLAGSKLIVQSITRIEGNLYGGITLDGASARFWGGQYTVKNNGAVGIAVSHGGSLHLTGEGIIEGHTRAGISLVGSAASLVGNISIRDNGTPAGTMNGGIIATSGSVVSLNTGTTGSITENGGPGLLVTHNSTARLQRATVSANHGAGVQVAALSSVLLFQANSIIGNTGFDLTCTPNSYGSGEKSGIGRMVCPVFDQSPAPPGGPGER